MDLRNHQGGMFTVQTDKTVKTDPTHPSHVESLVELDSPDDVQWEGQSDGLGQDPKARPAEGQWVHSDNPDDFE